MRLFSLFLVYFLVVPSFAATKYLSLGFKDEKTEGLRSCYYETELDLGAFAEVTPFQLLHADGNLRDIQKQYSVQVRDGRMYLKVFDLDFPKKDEACKAAVEVIFIQ